MACSRIGGFLFVMLMIAGVPGALLNNIVYCFTVCYVRLYDTVKLWCTLLLPAWEADCNRRTYCSEFASHHHPTFCEGMVIHFSCSTPNPTHEPEVSRRRTEDAHVHKAPGAGAAFWGA